MKTVIDRRMIFILLAAFFLSSCSAQGGDPHPPELLFGSDTCEECGMLVSDAKFAAATLTESGQTHKFDDLAEMFVFHAKHPEYAVRAWFVHDFITETWLRGETAIYVRSDRFRSPMNYGVAAFESREAAEAYSAELGGEILAFEALRAEFAAGR